MVELYSKRRLFGVTFIYYLKIGNRTNVSTEAKRRTNASKLVGNLEAKQTAANNPALSERGCDTNDDRSP